MLRFVTLLFCGFMLLTMVGCDIDLSEQHSKDVGLEEKINQNLRSRKNIFGDIIESVKLEKKSEGNYNFNFQKTDLEAQDVWDWTYRLLLIVDEQNTAVSTGRSSITVTGHMGKEKVVVGRMISGQTSNPVPFTITLEGKYAAETILEDWDRRRFKDKPVGAPQ
jgi:hypothetical protein